ncbi:unnamed protein product [Closterium sp. NIES-54]
MASLRILAFDHEGRPIQFDTWLDDLQLYLLSDSRDSVSLFDHTSGAAPAPPATADSATRSLWLTHDALARLAIRNHMPLAECAHFGLHRTAKALCPTSLRAVRDHFLALDPTALTVDLLEQHLLVDETSVVTVGAARGTPRTPIFEGCSPSPLAPSYASAAATDVLGAEDVGAASASGKRRNSKGKGGTGGGGGSGGGGRGSTGGGGRTGGGGGSGSGGGSGGFGGSGGGSSGGGGSGGSGSGGGRAGAPQRGGSGGGQRQQQQRWSKTLSSHQLREWFSQRGASGAQPLAPCLLAGDLAHTASDGGRLAMRRCSGSGDLVPLFAIRPRASSPPVLSPASSLALSLKRLAGNFTTPPRAVSSLLRTSRLTSRYPFTVSSPSALSLAPGSAPSGVSQLDPLPGPAPIQVAVGSGAARGAVSGGAASGGAASGGSEPGGAESEGAETGGAEPEGVETGGGEYGGAEPEGVEPGGSAGASPRLSPQQLREWIVQRARLWSGATGAGGARFAGVGGTGVAAGAGVTGGIAATSHGGARPRGAGAAGTGGVEGAGAGDPTESGAIAAGGSGAGRAGAGGARVGGTGVGGTGVGGAGVGGTGAGGAGAVDPSGAVRLRPYIVPLLQQVLGTPSSTSLSPPLLCPPPDQCHPPLQPASPLPAPSPYTEQSGGLKERRAPTSRPVSPVCTASRVPYSRPPCYSHNRLECA